MAEQFRTFPPQSIEIEIGGIVPCDQSQEWDSMILENVKEWITKNTNENVYVQARIMHTMMNILWVDTVKLVEPLPSIKTSVQVISIRQCLLEKKFAIENDFAFGLLKTLAEELGKRFHRFLNKQY